MRKLRYALELKGFRFLHILSPCPTGWKSEPSEGIELLRLAVRSGLYAVYEIFDGDRVVINVEPEMSEEALEKYFAGQGRFRKAKFDLALIRQEIDRSWEFLRARAAASPT
jgi:pyruvate/2-oxoacid:ferredoxin oxidoreductase beta subunit